MFMNPIVMTRPCTECTGRGPHTGPGHQYSPSRFREEDSCYIVGFLTCDLEPRYEYLWLGDGKWYREEMSAAACRLFGLSAQSL